MIMCGMIAPTIVSIIDATAQLESGGKKDATFVAHYMKEVVSKYDPNLLCSSSTAPATCKRGVRSLRRSTPGPTLSIWG